MTAPRWAVALLRLVSAPGRAEDLIGDFHELHARRVRLHGRVLAHLLTALEAGDIALTLIGQRCRGALALPGDESRGVADSADSPPTAAPENPPDIPDIRRPDMLLTIEAWTRDFAHAARNLSRAPGFTAVTVVTLALAIGANTAIFSVVDSVLLDPLRFPDADRLVSIRASAPGSDLPEEFGPGFEFYVEYRENADLLEDLGLLRSGQTTVRARDRIDRLFFTQATPSLFTTLGVTPVLGRLPTPEDEPFHVVLISHWLWRDWFGSDPQVIGQAYEMAGGSRTVIGVMGPEFQFPTERTAVWVYAMLGDERQIRLGSFGNTLVGRLTPGAGHEDLEAQLAVLARRLPERFGGSARYAELIAQHRPVVRSLEEAMVGDIAGPLWLLLGTVAIVLLIACANVANLFIVRAESRRRELAVRQALGAGRAGLVRIQMVEALLLAGLGGVVGVLLAWVGLPLVVRAAPESIPNLAATRLDLTALAFSAAVAFLSACAFGLLPALRFSRPRLDDALREAGRGVRVGRTWSRNALVLLQTASALVLLVGSGLLIRSFWTLSQVDPGYDTENIFTFQVSPDRDDVNDSPSFARFHEGFLERVAALPGVESVGLTHYLPLDEGAATDRFLTEQTVSSGELPPPLRYTQIGGDYFETMGISVLQGRPFERSDHVTGAHAIVSEAAARLLWPGEDAIGKRIALPTDPPSWQTVVGVVEDVLVRDLRQETADPMVYLSMVGPSPGSWTVGSPAYVVKSPRAEVLAPDIRALMREVVPESPMYRVFTMNGLAARSMARLSFTMLMLAIASGLALVLGAVGLYGVLSYVVSRRAPEIAVRMALGAESGRVLRMVVLQGARVTLAGVALGLLAALAFTRLLDSLLYGVGTLDTSTFAAMSGLMLAVALLASYIPARRASSVDPVQSLRSE